MIENIYTLYTNDGKRHKFTDPNAISDYLSSHHLYLDISFQAKCKLCERHIRTPERNKPCIKVYYVGSDRTTRVSMFRTERHDNHEFTSHSAILRDSNHDIVQGEQFRLILVSIRPRYQYNFFDSELYKYKQRFISQRKTHDGWGYYRNPSTFNERKLYHASLVDCKEVGIFIRGRRKANNLPNNWDDYYNNSRRYKGWKNIRVKKQWMVDV